MRYRLPHTVQGNTSPSPSKSFIHDELVVQIFIQKSKSFVRKKKRLDGGTVCAKTKKGICPVKNWFKHYAH